MDDDLYRENILDHYKNPRNKGVLENPTFKHRHTNPLCGDEIDLYLKLSDEGIVEGISFDGVGCAISMASVSMLSEKVLGKTIDELKKLDQKNIIEMLGTEPNEARMRCAMLPLDTLHGGIKKYYT